MSDNPFADPFSVSIKLLKLNEISKIVKFEIKTPNISLISRLHHHQKLPIHQLLQQFRPVEQRISTHLQIEPAVPHPLHLQIWLSRALIRSFFLLFYISLLGKKDEKREERGPLQLQLLRID